MLSCTYAQKEAMKQVKDGDVNLYTQAVNEKWQDIEDEIQKESQELMDEDDYKSAIAKVRDGIMQLSKLTDGHSIYEAQLLMKLSEILTLDRQKEQAIHSAQLSLKMFIEIRGAKSEDTYNSLFNLADTYVRFSAWEEAIPVVKKLAKIAKKKHGPYSKIYRESLRRLAKTYMSAGMPDRDEGKDKPDKKLLKKASKSFKKMLKLLKRKKLDDELLKEKAGTLLTVARLEFELNNVLAALDYTKMAGELKLSLFGRLSMEYVQVLNALARLHERMDEDAEALLSMQEALDITEHLHEPDDDIVKKAHSNLEGITRHIGAKKCGKTIQYRSF